MKRHAIKLNLNRETLLRLTANDLRGVAVGAVPTVPKAACTNACTIAAPCSLHAICGQ